MAVTGARLGPLRPQTEPGAFLSPPGAPDSPESSEPCPEAPQPSPERGPRGSGPEPRTEGTRAQASSRCQAAPRPEALSCPPPEGGQTPHLCSHSAAGLGAGEAGIAPQPWGPSAGLLTLASPGSLDSRPVPATVLSFWLPAGSRLFPPRPVPPTNTRLGSQQPWTGVVVAQSLLLVPSSSSVSADTWLGGAPEEGGGLMGE